MCVSAHVCVCVCVSVCVCVCMCMHACFMCYLLTVHYSMRGSRFRLGEWLLWLNDLHAA